MRFTTTNHQTWTTLFTRQLPHVDQFASSVFKEGLHHLQLSPAKIPTIPNLNSQITPRSNWKVTRTESRYMTRDEWFSALAHKHFPITGYIREQEELDFTPEPDIFHDIFGHQPFMTLPEYVEMFDMFAAAYPKADTDEKRRNIGQLAWFGYEFGLIREQDELRAFGAGLLSSFSEIQNINSNSVTKKPFTVENVINGAKPDGKRSGDRVYGVTENSELFVFESLKALKSELKRYFNTL